MQEQKPAFAAEVGRRIQRLRHARGLSLSELAHRAAVGKATLSGLEAGTRNPTLETLYAITAQLEVPLASVLTDPGTRTDPTEAVHGAAVSATLLETFVDATVITELYRLRIRPGRVQISPAHPRGVVEYLTVFSGTARVGPADDPIVAEAGDHVRWAADVPHLYSADDGADVHASLLIRHGAPG
ncbi:MAG: family transcriptional regulator [Actinomycetia bacterium]|nr:family transcriptional regulator [Actinomycetes bacterium]